MILTGRDVKWYVERGKLRFNPELTESQFQQNGVDLRLARGIGRLGETGISVGRLNTSGVRDAYEHFTNGFCYLAHTVEVIEMPDDLMAFVELRSTWARCGLILPPTIVDAGFHGDLTLEIFCAGPSIKIPFEERFAHLIFARLTGPSEPYKGKYQHQRGVTGARQDKEW